MYPKAAEAKEAALAQSCVLSLQPLSQSKLGLWFSSGEKWELAGTSPNLSTPKAKFAGSLLLSKWGSAHKAIGSGV